MSAVITQIIDIIFGFCPGMRYTYLIHNSLVPRPPHLYELGIHTHFNNLLPFHPLGFGSLIRAIGMQINKSNNKQACRDLSGRRVRDINAEKK